MKRTVLALALALTAVQPAAAQIFWKSPDYTGLPIAPGEAGIGVPLPGATPEEERANLAWQLRAGLNVAALQCQRYPTLLSKDIYGGVLINHKEELAKSYETLRRYFARTSASPKAGQQALDRYGTKTYAGLSAVRGILGFCETSSRIGNSALFAPRGSLTAVAIERLREMRNSLGPGYEQQFSGIGVLRARNLPDMRAQCWSGNNYKTRCSLIAPLA